MFWCNLGRTDRCMVVPFYRLWSQCWSLSPWQRWGLERRLGWPLGRRRRSGRRLLVPSLDRHRGAVSWRLYKSQSRPSNGRRAARKRHDSPAPALLTKKSNFPPVAFRTSDTAIWMDSGDSTSSCKTSMPRLLKSSTFAEFLAIAKTRTPFLWNSWASASPIPPLLHPVIRADLVILNVGIWSNWIAEKGSWNFRLIFFRCIHWEVRETRRQYCTKIMESISSSVVMVWNIRRWFKAE